MIEINIGASVEYAGRQIGRVESVVLDRENYEATHLVVRHGNALQRDLRLMPIGWVRASTHDRVEIAHTEEELSSLTRFEVQHYTSLDEARDELEQTRSRIRPADWINYFVPLVAKAFGEPVQAPGIVITDRMLEPSESTVGRGLAVESSDGHRVGSVHEVLLSQPDWRLSGVIIERGLVRTHLMRLPADWIARVERDRLVLNRTREQVEDWEREKD